MVILVSNCLLGIECRYKGDSQKNDKVLEFLKGHTVIGVCPEVMGGLPIPRDPAEIVGDKLLTPKGKDVTKEYATGANLTLQIAKANKVDLCILKAKSPSCGTGKIYDGTFQGQLIDGNGVTSKLLQENGFKVITENDL